MSKYSEKAEAALSKVIQAFKDGSVAEKCALATYPMPNIPSEKWTLHNRWLCLIQTGEVDCRGVRQWNDAGRKVTKGSKAAFILRPRLIKVEDDDGSEEQRCVGFAGVPVFPASMTEGEPLEYEKLKLPKLPLLNVAKAWDIDVVPQPFTKGYFGYWSPMEKRIVLCAEETSVFLHELCHAAHDRVSGPKTKQGQDPLREIVAELGAEVLRRLLGSDKDTSGNSYGYIETYAAKQKKTLLDACLAVLRETAKVVALVLETAEKAEAA